MNPENNKNEVMTLPEVADYLQLAERTVLRMSQRGEIPAAKIASQWRFMRSVIQDWLAAKVQVMPTSKIRSVVQKNDTFLPLQEVIRPELMNLNILPGPKEKVLKQLVEPLQKTAFIQDSATLLQSLIERERMMTTAVGHGIAMPHPRKPIQAMFPEPAIAVGICPQGTNFEAVDDQLVHLFFLICATREEIHLQLMAKISWLARQNDVVAKLKQASSPQDAMVLIKKTTEKIDLPIVNINSTNKLHKTKKRKKKCC